jgi:hypothetical protein
MSQAWWSPRAANWIGLYYKHILVESEKLLKLAVEPSVIWEKFKPGKKKKTDEIVYLQSAE